MQKIIEGNASQEHERKLSNPTSLCPVLPIGAENLPGKITAQGSAVAQQPTRRRRALDCDLARRDDARHGGRATPRLSHGAVPGAA